MGVNEDSKAEALSWLRHLPATLTGLVERRQWVVWQFEKRDGRATKVPYDPVSKRRASTTDPHTWRSFEEAAAAYKASDRLDGIGFVFTPEDPFSGIDLDDCLGENGEPFPWAQQILDSLQTYTEISPSGRGLKLFLEGKLPEGGRRKGSIEMYESGRYFTVTGRHLEGTPKRVEKRQAELEALHHRTFSKATGQTGTAGPGSGGDGGLTPQDQELLEKARNARNGKKFRTLFDEGDISDYGGDDSRADAALCALLAFWCKKDPEQIDHLFRRSRLFRPKWDSRRGNSTYGAGTISQAVNLVGENNGSSADLDDYEPAGKPTQAQQLVALAEDFDLFHSADHTEYASVLLSGHFETWALRSTAIRRLLIKRFFEAYDKPPGVQAQQDAIAVLEAKAAFDGPELSVSTRVAEQAGVIFVDLVDPDWQCAEITAQGWQILKRAPVKFIRSKGMEALPLPVRGGSLEELRGLINFPDDHAFILCCAFLIASVRPKGPFPLLTFVGEQGSAKTSAARMIRQLIDPSLAPLRTMPRCERDLLISASHSWVLGFDNLSGLPAWLSDALCRLATGSAFATRQLYSDDEERIFVSVRPAVLNGIEDVATRPDLLDRSLVLTLQAIPEDQRMTAEEMEQAFQAKRPRLLGAIFDAVSCGLRNHSSVRLEKLPRMADFAQWVVAAEPALPWEPGAFLEAYAGNRAESVQVALDADPVATAVQAFLRKVGRFEGTATELLEELSSRASEREVKSRSWPRNARSLSGRLRRAAAGLRSVGIDVRFGHGSGRNRTRVIHLEQGRKVASAPSVASANDENSSQATDKKSDYSKVRARTQNGLTDANTLRSDAKRTQRSGL